MSVVRTEISFEGEFAYAMVQQFVHSTEKALKILLRTFPISCPKRKRAIMQYIMVEYVVGIKDEAEVGVEG